MKIAEQSPRECKDGTIRWYYGDTFVLTFILSLFDENYKPITIGLTDKIEVIFKDYNNKLVSQFDSVGTNEVNMIFDVNISNKFVEGIYTFTTKFNGDYITTIMKNNKVVVE